MRIHLTFFGLALLGCCFVCEAQNDPASTSVFEVVSIKPSQSGPFGGAQELPNGEHYVDTTFDLLIRGAYGIYNEGQVVGMPSWAKSDRYDVEARVDRATAESWKTLSSKDRWKQEQPMLQAMLADRCKLKVHYESKELPVYDLVIVRGGLKMKKSSAGEESLESVRNGSIVGRAISIKSLIHAIPSDGRLIVDKTNLEEEKFDFDLNWAAGAQSSDADAGPSLFTALEEQLGLKLVSSKALAKVLVIDHIEKPSSN